MSPPGQRNGPGVGRPESNEQDEQLAGGRSDVSVAAPLCSYCDVVYLRADRRTRRRFARMGHVAPEWVAAHADGCPKGTVDDASGTRGWMAAGRTRSPFRRGGAL